MLETAVGIQGIGWFLPPKVRGNDFWPATFKPLAEEARRSDVLSVERSTRGDRPTLAPEIAAAMAELGDDPFKGAKHRHVIDDDAEVSDMEAVACQRAMRAAGVGPDDIDLVIVGSLVPDRLHPSNAPAVQAKCELTRASAWSLELGCASFQPQLVTAAALIRAGVYRRVLIVQSAAVSRIVDYSTPVSTTLGDGAAAAVIGEVPHGRGLLGQWMRTDGSLREGLVFAPVLDGKPLRRWDHAAAPIVVTSFDPDATKLAGRRATEYCREACLGALDAAGLALDDVDFYVGNQSLGWFVDACRRSLDLPKEKTIDTYQEVGSIGPATILYNLDRAARQGRIKDGDVVLAYAPGAGLARTAVVYRWCPPRKASR